MRETTPDLFEGISVAVEAAKTLAKGQVGV
jgi:hypothetical protein